MTGLARTRASRTFIGSVVLMLYMLAFVLLAMKLVSLVPRQPMLIELAIYVVLGFIWIVPLKPLFKWMGRGV